MKSLVQSTVSFLDKRFSFAEFHSSPVTCCALVSGYSYPSEPDSHGFRVEPGRQHAAAVVYAEMAARAPWRADDAVPACRQSLDGRKIFRACIAAANGTLARFNEDTVLAEFEDADSALQCAVNLQIALRKRNACLGPGYQLRYHLGVDLCEARKDRTNRRDKRVYLAAQLAKSNHYGGICVSPSVRKNLSKQSKLRFVSLGKRYLPGCEEPVEAFWIEMDRSLLFEAPEAKHGGALAVVS